MINNNKTCSLLCKELEDSVIDTTPDIKTTCLSCGYTENVPDFIYDEMSRKKYHFKIRRKVSTLHCQKCGKETAISAYWLKNIIS
ncbi:MAG: hypothetical protein PHU94_01665 [Bacilli bacterium]|nr:hypothetical protein [Bacilli bacterium]MDD4734331.1 hypothetical protein [Bacilli bacterium]